MKQHVTVENKRCVTLTTSLSVPESYRENNQVLVLICPSLMIVMGILKGPALFGGQHCSIANSL